MATQQEIGEAAAQAVAEIEAEQKAKEPEAPKAPEAKPEPAKEPEKEPAKEPEPEKSAEVPKRVPRKADLIPATKFHEVRHELQAERQKAKDLEDRLKALEAAKAEAPKADDDIEGVAKKHGLEKEVVADILDLAVRKSSKPPADIEERLKRIEAEKKLSEDAANYQKEEMATLEKFPELKKYASDLKELAYTEGYESVKLEDLAAILSRRLNLDTTTAPAEGASAPPAGKGRDLDNLTEEDIANLSPAELDRYIEKTRYRRSK